MLDIIEHRYTYEEEYVISKEEYNKFLYAANYYVNHVIYEAFLYLRDQLDEFGDCEGRLRRVFPEFFVNRFGKDIILQRIESIKDAIGSRISISLTKPFDEFILYFVIENYDEDFRGEIEKINRNPDNAIKEYYSRFCTKNPKVEECVDYLTELYLCHKNDIIDEDMNLVSCIYWVCCEVIICKGDLLFDDEDFMPDFLDLEVGTYIRCGGNKEGYEKYLGVELNNYTDCMHDIVREQYIEFQKQYEDDAPNSILSEDGIFLNIYKSLISVQENNIYRDKDEDTITDGIRDRLKMLYEVSDQSRCGTSSAGKNAGEVDLKISDNGITVTLIEAVSLRGMSRKVLTEHLDKLLVKYDASGCKFLFTLIYYKGGNLQSFWNKYLEYMEKEYVYPYKFTEYENFETLMHTESRAMRVKLLRDGIDTSLYCIAVRI